jgi:hypothetical protein
MALFALVLTLLSGYYYWRTMYWRGVAELWKETARVSKMAADEWRTVAERHAAPEPGGKVGG